MYPQILGPSSQCDKRTATQWSQEMGYGVSKKNKQKEIKRGFFLFVFIDKSLCKCTTKYFWIIMEIIIKKNYD